MQYLDFHAAVAEGRQILNASVIAKKIGWLKEAQEAVNFKIVPKSLSTM